MLPICQIFHLTRQIHRALPRPFFPQRDNRFKAIYSTSLKSKVELNNKSWGLHWIELHLSNAAGKQQKSEYCSCPSFHHLHRDLTFFCIDFLLVYSGFKMPREGNFPSSPDITMAPVWNGQKDKFNRKNNQALCNLSQNHEAFFPQKLQLYPKER